MSSTSSKNTPGNYEAEQFDFKKRRAYDNYHGRVINDNNLHPGDGLLSGRCPGTILSHNSIDIESELFGVGSTNLVHKKKKTEPNFKNLKSLSVYDKPMIIIPVPLVVPKYQRPSFI
jgi:hypothetical protein